MARSYGERAAPAASRGSPPPWLPLFAHLDLVAGGREHVPLGAEVIAALARRLTGRTVAGEGVQRVPVVGHLGRAVAALDAAELRSGQARPGGRPALRRERGPHARARATARARLALVGLEQVQGPSR